MDELKWKHLTEEVISSLFGAALLVLDIIYIFRNLSTLTLTQVLVCASLGCVGFVFLFVKDSLITGLWNKKIQNE